MKKLFGSLLAVLVMISGCSAKQNTSEVPTASASSTPSGTNLAEEYTDLKDDNMFVYLQKDSVVNMLEHGTGIVFFGFPECKWCQAYITQLEEVLEENNIHAQYFNIYTEKSEDRDFYDSIVNILNEKNTAESQMIWYDNNGLETIYMPLVLFIKDGELISFDNETCSEDAGQISPSDYWTEEKKTALKTRLNKSAAEIKAAQDANNAQGCDNGCELGGES